MLAGQGESAGATGAFQEFLDEKDLDTHFEGYLSSNKAATIDAIKATYGEKADLSVITATAKEDIKAADAKMETLGIDPKTVAAETIVISTQQASPTAMGSHIMAKSAAFGLLGLADKADMTMTEVNKAFKVAMRQPDADRGLLINARSLLRADLSAQGASMQPAPKPGSSNTP